MALIVEDGTGLANADAFISLADAESYYLSQYGVAWSGDNGAKEAAIRRATRYLDGLMWIGSRLNGRDQSLSWPRTGVIDCDGDEVDSDSVPVEVVDSNALLAFFELTNPDGLSPAVTLSQIAKREKVDVIEVEYKDTAATAESSRPVLTAVTDMLRCFLANNRAKFLKRA